MDFGDLFSERIRSVQMGVESELAQGLSVHTKKLTFYKVRVYVHDGRGAHVKKLRGGAWACPICQGSLMLPTCKKSSAQAPSCETLLTPVQLEACYRFGAFSFY